LKEEGRCCDLHSKKAPIRTLKIFGIVAPFTVRFPKGFILAKSAKRRGIDAIR
jgi:hypothetical protein